MISVGEQFPEILDEVVVGIDLTTPGTSPRGRQKLNSLTEYKGLQMALNIGQNADSYGGFDEDKIVHCSRP